MKCEYLGCTNEATTTTSSNGDTVQYDVCEEHVGKLDYIMMEGKVFE